MRVFILALVLLVLPIGAAGAEISDEYGVGTSNTTIFAGVVEKLPLGTHYVYWRESQYVYALAYSETMSFDGASFSASDVTVVRYDSGGGYQSPATFYSDDESGFELDPEEYLVYSDLGHFPDLIERGGVTYQALACVMLGSFVIWALLDRLVRASKRS